jgi:hypothetical protein
MDLVSVFCRLLTSFPLLQPLDKVFFILLTTEFFSLFVVLGLELRAFTLSHSTSPIFVKSFLR